MGQALGLPATMTAFAFIGVAVTSATIVLFGEAIWDPVVLIARIGSPVVIVFGALIIMLAQLTTNMAANVVSPANDFSSLAPKTISYVTGGLITAAIGVLMMPWKLYADASAYIFTWLIGYSSLMGAIGGILIADYWIIRKKQLSLEDLFKPHGRYSYTGGVNRRAMVILVVSILPVVPGFVRAAMTPGGQVAQSQLLGFALYVCLVCYLRPEFRVIHCNISRPPIRLIMRRDDEDPGKEPFTAGRRSSSSPWSGGERPPILAVRRAFLNRGLPRSSAARSHARWWRPARSSPSPKSKSNRKPTASSSCCPSRSIRRSKPAPCWSSSTART